jgi:hypothetical protein
MANLNFVSLQQKKVYMKLFDRIVEKLQRVSHTNGTVVNDEASSTADVLNQNIAFAISYAANMQGVSFLQEETDIIREVIERAVARKMDSKKAKETKKPKLEQKEESDDCRYNRYFTQFQNYLNAHYALRFNVITNQTEIAKIKEDITELEFKPANDRVRGTICQNAQRKGIGFWGKDVDRYINSEEVEEYHPFLQYFEKLPAWDGKDRVSALAQRVSEDANWVNGFHRWMLAMSAQWMGYARRRRGVCNTRANSVAPIIISQEQGWGKSTFCRMLVPEELQRYYTDSFDVAQPASCEKKLMDYGLINLDEFDRIPAKRGSQLKNLMQMTALNIRRTFQKTSAGCFRLASFIGTSNCRELLTDKTGSRRFLCVELEHPIDCDTPIEYEQLYAQLKHEILSGERYWFSKEEETVIQKNNQFYYKEVPVEEIFRKTFREVDRSVKGRMYLTADEVFLEMKKAHPTEMCGVNMENFNRVLPTFARRWHTHDGSRYCVVRVE